MKPCERQSVRKQTSSKLDKSEAQQHAITSSNIPIDLIFDILLMLPVKSLLRFRCVSKCWLALISSRHFVKSHLQKSADMLCNNDCTRHRILFKTGDSKLTSLQGCSLNSAFYDSAIEATDNYNFMEDNGYGKYKPVIVGSCHGLVCVLIPQDQILLWNATCKVTTKLPKFSRNKLHNDFFFYVDMQYGFGYDESRDDYKVVGFCRVPKEVKIYCLKTGSWRRITHPHLELSRLKRGKYFANEKLYCVAYPTGLGGIATPKILCLDLSNETYGEVEQPDCGDCIYGMSLNVLGGYLSVVCSYHSNKNVDVWIMKEYGVKDSWTKLASIFDYNLYFSVWQNRCTPLFLSKEGRFLFKLWENLALYNPENDAVTTRCTNLGFSRAFVIVESLVSPRSCLDGEQR